MALLQGGDEEPVRWTDDLVPYLQFYSIDIHFSDGRFVNLEARLDDDYNYFGLFLKVESPMLELYEATESDFLRTRELITFPMGCIEDVHPIVDEYGQCVSLELLVNGIKIRFLAGEICWQDGKPEIVTPQEFILVEF